MKSSNLAPLASTLLALALVAPALAQTAAPTPTPAPAQATRQTIPATTTQEDAEDDVVRITANLVQFDAVVVDKDGRQVADLRPEDFEVLVEGKPQQITNFSYVSTATGTVTSQPVIAARGRDSVAPPPPPVRLRPEQVRRTVALVFDDLGTSFESTANVRRALKKFVDEQMQPGDLVAILRTSAGMGALQQFTSDKRLLYKAIERVRWYPSGRAGVSSFAPLEVDPAQQARRQASEALAERFGNNSEVERLRNVNIARNAEEQRARERGRADATDEFREELFSVGTLGALNFIIKGMKELPGRKSVVMFSDGFEIYKRDDVSQAERVIGALRRLADLANRASVAVYTVDARGLPVLGLTASDSTAGMTSQEIEQQLSDRTTKYFDTQEGLRYLSQQTGGLFTHSTNDLGGGIQRALDDQKGFYLIGFRPDEDLFGAERERARFNKFQVKLKRAGLRVRTRGGFYGFTDEEARPVRRTRSEQMFAAINSPFSSGELGLRLTSLFSAGAAKVYAVESLLHIDASRFALADEPDGWKRLVFDVIALTFGEDGQPVDEINRTETVRLRGEPLKYVLDHGLVYKMIVPVKKPGAYQLRVAVRDSASERVGSASQFIEVPDLRKDRLAISGILLTTSPPAAARPAAAAATAAPANNVDPNYDPLRDAAVRRFRQGARVDFLYHIYNAKTDKATGRPQLQTQMRLFRDGQPAYTGKPLAYNVSPQADAKRLRAGSRLTLGSELPPGDYVLQVIVTDALAKREHAVATQWIDFEIVTSDR